MANTALEKKEARTEPAHEVTRGNVYTPRVDIYETTDELLLFADMPGVAPGDVDIRFENGELSLHGRVGARLPSQGVLLKEYGIGDFYRVFTITETIDANKITAEMKNGVLTVHLPKAEALKPRKITVTGG
ncbi:MAG: Hsp20/alpha crystallin family protein [Gemmataceae bacterium]|nr:Hsp20/alpha crystallin family protein [Gemmataceae bacterium]MDW8266914.1 Hsp20/alpha crystallin family protein [Gemmataceae bacterium]